MSGCIITDDSIQTCLNINWWVKQLWWYFCVLEKKKQHPFEKNSTRVFDWRRGTKTLCWKWIPCNTTSTRGTRLQNGNFFFPFMFIYTVNNYNCTTLSLKLFSNTQWQLNHQCKLHYFHESKINHLATDVIYLIRQIKLLTFPVFLLIL